MCLRLLYLIMVCLFRWLAVLARCTLMGSKHLLDRRYLGRSLQSSLLPCSGPCWWCLAGTINLVACLVTERISWLLAVGWEELGWWGSTRRRTEGLASRRRSSATVSGWHCQLARLFGDMGMVGSAGLISEAGVRRPWLCP